MPLIDRLKALTGAITFAVCGAYITAVPASAAAPMVRTQAPGFYRMMLGDFEITAINDGTVSLDVMKLLAQPPEKTAAALKKSFESSPLETSDNAFLINTGSKLVLIDTGGGTLLGPTLGKLLTNLRAAGYQPDEVDDIFLTHMHPDHAGGLMDHGKRAFSNAMLHADLRESDYWLSQANLDESPTDAKGYFKGAMASVNPYVTAGKYQWFDNDSELVPGVRSLASHGHTPGHTSYLIESKGHKLIILGDLIHVAAVQFNDPGVTIAFDSDPNAAAESRKKMFSETSANAALVGAPHLQFPGLGHLRAVGKSWQWVPINFSTQLH